MLKHASPRSLLPLLILQGCIFDSVVALSPEAKNVEVVRDVGLPTDCDFKGKINGRSRSSDQKEARKGAENEFRNQAAELKANFAMIEAERSGPVGTTSKRETFIGGKAYFCRTPEMIEAEEKRKEKELAEKEEKERLAAEEKERKEAEEKEKREAEAAAEKAEKAEKK